MGSIDKPEFQSDVGESAHHQWGWQLEPLDAGRTRVTEFFDCSRSPDWLQKAVKGGEQWRPGIEASLENLERLVVGPSRTPRGGPPPPRSTARRGGLVRTREQRRRMCRRSTLWVLPAPYRAATGLTTSRGDPPARCPVATRSGRLRGPNRRDLTPVAKVAREPPTGRGGRHGLADQFLVGAAAVHIGRVEERHAELIARWMVAIDSAWVPLPFPPTGAGGRYRAPTKFGTASNHEEGAEC